MFLSSAITRHRKFTYPVRRESTDMWEILYRKPILPILCYKDITYLRSVKLMANNKELNIYNIYTLFTIIINLLDWNIKLIKYEIRNEKERSVNMQDFFELLITVLSAYYALTMKRAMQWASFTLSREESPVYAIISRSFSFFSYPLHDLPRISFTLPIGSRRAVKPFGAEKRRSRAIATRTTPRLQQVLFSRRRHCRKKIRWYGQKKRENVFVLGFHVRS